MTASAAGDLSGKHLSVVNTGNREKRVDAKGNPCALEVNPNPSTRRFRDRPPCYHLQMTTL